MFKKVKHIWDIKFEDVVEDKNQFVFILNYNLAESDGWNSEEEQVMGNLRKGKYQLSRSNSDISSDEDK